METQNWLLKQAATQPDKIAVDDGERQLSFKQIKELTEENVDRLNQCNPGARVGLLADNSIESYEIALAILCSGRTIVWLNWRLADEELQRQLKDSNLSLCLVANSLWRSSMDERFVSYPDF